MSPAHPDDSPVDDLAEEFARRWRDGERPSVEEYAARFPRWAAEIHDLFPAVLMMEQLKPRREPPPPAVRKPVRKPVRRLRTKKPAAWSG